MGSVLRLQKVAEGPGKGPQLMEQIRKGGLLQLLPTITYSFYFSHDIAYICFHH